MMSYYDLIKGEAHVQNCQVSDCPTCMLKCEKLGAPFWGR